MKSQRVGAHPRRRPFNSPTEVGLRALFLLDASEKTPLDLQRLVTFDYLAVHSADAGGPPSIHPELPFRGGEWLVHREVMRAGLDLMFAKEVIEKTSSSEGLAYRSSEMTKAFLAHLTSAYAKQLRTRAEWVIHRFGSLHDAQLAAFMTEHIGRWGAEFTPVGEGEG